MLKLTFCLHRLPGMSREAFQDYWYNQHGPLVARLAETLGIKRYVQSHALDHPFNDATRQSRGAPESYDGIAEIWFESWESLLETANDPATAEAGNALLEDEKKFIDLNRSPIWFNQEKVVIE
ncbi:MAG: EthD domain-containing protein [Pseudomonadota bacterium]